MGGNQHYTCEINLKKLRTPTCKWLGKESCLPHKHWNTEFLFHDGKQNNTVQAKQAN